jgi:hypothetical protein
VGSFRLIDWLMELPPTLDRQFWKDVGDFQKERTMPFLTTPERIALQDRTWTLIEDILRAKFGDAGVALMPEVKNIYDFDQLRDLHLTVWNASSLDEVRTAFPPQPSANPAES